MPSFLKAAERTACHFPVVWVYGTSSMAARLINRSSSPWRKWHFQSQARIHSVVAPVVSHQGSTTSRIDLNRVSVSVRLGCAVRVATA